MTRTCIFMHYFFLNPVQLNDQFYLNVLRFFTRVWYLLFFITLLQNICVTSCGYMYHISRCIVIFFKSNKTDILWILWTLSIEPSTYHWVQRRVLETEECLDFLKYSFQSSHAERWHMDVACLDYRLLLHKDLDFSNHPCYCTKLHTYILSFTFPTLIYYGQSCSVLNLVASDIFQDLPADLCCFLKCDWSPAFWKLKGPSAATIHLWFHVCLARLCTYSLPNLAVGPWCWEHTCHSGCSLRGQLEQLILCDTFCNNS